MAFGGNGLVSSALHSSLLFPKMRGMILGLIPAGILISGFTLTIFQLLVSAGVPLYSLFVSFSCIQVGFVVFNIIFQPFRPFKLSDVPLRDNQGFLIRQVKEEPPPAIKELENTVIGENASQVNLPLEDSVNHDQTQEIDERTSTEQEIPVPGDLFPDKPETTSEDTLQPVSSNDSIVDEIRSPEPVPDPDAQTPKQEVTHEKTKHEKAKIKPFWKHILTVEFWLITYYLSANSIAYQWYNSTLFNQFTLMGDSDHYFATGFNFSLLAVLVVFPLYGLVVKTLGVIGTISFTIFQSISLMTIISIPYLYIQPIGFLIFLTRPILVAATFEFIHAAFGFHSIGRIFGVMSVVIGMASFLLIPLKIGVTALGNRYWIINIIIIGLQFTTFIAPAYLLIQGLWKGTIKCCSTRKSRENDAKK